MNLLDMDIFLFDSRTRGKHYRSGSACVARQNISHMVKLNILTLILLCTVF